MVRSLFRSDSFHSSTARDSLLCFSDILYYVVCSLHIMEEDAGRLKDGRQKYQEGRRKELVGRVRVEGKDKEPEASIQKTQVEVEILSRARASR